MKILIVEDELDMAEFIAEVFKEEYEGVWTAKDGVHALEVFAQNPGISCVISDINMPRMNGIDLCKKLKQVSPDVPVFLMTAELDREENARLAGAADVIIKPFPVHKLRTWIQGKMPVGQPVKNK